MIEHIILSNLTYNEEYARKVLPYLTDEYFKDKSDELIFSIIKNHITNFNVLPTKNILFEELSNFALNERLYEDTQNKIKSLVDNESNNMEWLINNTEKFCRDQAVYNALRRSLEIFDGNTNENVGIVPDILSEAISVSFNNKIGHDFWENFEERYEFYQEKEDKIALDLEILNKIMKGGASRKTLNILIAGTGVGKTLAMCHMAAAYLMAGKNVLYITNEMSEEKIAERIDANILNIDIGQLVDLPKPLFVERVKKYMARTPGRLIIKEYPTASANVIHFDKLLLELKTKKNFIPDIIFVDYLNICSSARFKQTGGINSYTYVKAIAEELRGFAVKNNVILWTATQVNRSGYSDSDFDLENTSESFGVPATADIMLALISTEDLEKMNQILVKQLKNRYSDVNFHKRFVIGIDRAKMKLYDVEETAQKDLINQDPIQPNKQDDSPFF